MLQKLLLGRSSSLSLLNASRIICLTSSKCLLSARAPDEKRFAPRACMELVRKFDYENYLCCLTLKGSVRRAAFAIRAFNIEASQVLDNFSSPVFGRMRYEWWRSVIEDAFQNKSHNGHPVTEELFWLISNHKISKRWLLVLLNVRENQFLPADSKKFEPLQDFLSSSPRSAHRNPPSSQSDDPRSTAVYKSQETQELYAEAVCGTPLLLTLEAAGLRREVSADHAANHIGRALGLCAALRSLPGALQSAEPSKPLNLPLPADILQQHGWQFGEAVHLHSDAVRETAWSLACAAQVHLERAAALQTQVPRGTARAILLPGLPARHFLERLRRTTASADQLDLRRASLSSAWLPAHLFGAVLRARFT